MKLEFFIVLSVVSLVLCHDMAYLKPVYDSCKPKFPSIANLPTIEEMLEINFETSDPQVKCFIHCLSETTGEVDSNGNLIASGLEKIGWGEKAKIEAAVAACNGIKGSDKCDTSYQQYGCFMMKMM